VEKLINKCPLSVVIICTALLLTGSMWKQNVSPLSHDAYVWQRLWTPALKQALRISAHLIDHWHVLAAELSENGQFIHVDLDAKALKETARPVILVIRINGQWTKWQSESVIQNSLDLVNKWRQKGIDVTGLEIDYDCATAKLSTYAVMLGKLRQTLSNQKLVLMITALPSWLKSAELTNLINQSDEVVLQVHSVMNPQQGLLDIKKAESWVNEFSSLTNRRFRVALPNYGSRISWDNQGQPIAVESETPMVLTTDFAQELSIQPQTIAKLLDVWRSHKPFNMIGIVWFRLPTRDDQRAWSLRTWHAVMQQKSLMPVIVAEAKPAKATGVFDVVIKNISDIDSTAPIELKISNTESCNAADALNAYRLRRTKHELQFYLSQNFILKAHHQSLVGWLLCKSGEVQVHVD
jgi:Protein of unknown function (DUF3142)